MTLKYIERIWARKNKFEKIIVLILRRNKEKNKIVWRFLEIKDKLHALCNV